jgi:hypothetical protein
MAASLGVVALIIEGPIFRFLPPSCAFDVPSGLANLAVLDLTA